MLKDEASARQALLHVNRSRYVPKLFEEYSAKADGRAWLEEKVVNADTSQTLSQP